MNTNKQVSHTDGLDVTMDSGSVNRERAIGEDECRSVNEYQAMIGRVLGDIIRSAVSAQPETGQAVPLDLTQPIDSQSTNRVIDGQHLLVRVGEIRAMRKRAGSLPPRDGYQAWTMLDDYLHDLLKRADIDE